MFFDQVNSEVSYETEKNPNLYIEQNSIFVKLSLHLHG